jgi:hypothetical protein
MNDRINKLAARLTDKLPPTALQEPITGYLGHHSEDDPMLTDDNKRVYFRAEDPEAPEVDTALISQRLLRLAEGYLQHNTKLEIVRTKSNKLKVKDIDNEDEADSFALTPLESNVQIGSGNLTGDPLTLEMGGTEADLSEEGPGYLAQLTLGAAVSNIKCKFDATDAPDVNDDSSQGYSVSSRWLDTTNDKEYVCLDASVGAAVWKETTPSSTVDSLDFTEQGSDPASPANTVGRIFAKDENSYTETYLKDSTGLLRNLTRDIVITARNVSGSSMGKGRIVRVSGVNSSLPQIALALADTVANAEGILAILLEDIATSANGRVMLQGIAVVNTSLVAPGDIYLSASTPGSISTSAPTIPRKLGQVLTQSATGLILFSPEPIVFPMGSLATGLVKSTTGTGVPSIATAGTDYVAPNTGTNVINTNMLTDANVTDAKIATLTATKLRGTANRLIQTKGVGTAAEELGGATDGDFPRWSGATWAVVRPSYDEIVASASLGADTASLSFASLSTLSGDFDHLVILLQLRSNVALSRDGLIIKLNNDATAANYYSFTARQSHSATLSTSEALGTIGGINSALSIVGNSAGAGIHTNYRLTLWNYKELIYKMCTFESYVPYGAGGQFQYTSGGSLYQSTTAITRIDVLPETGTAFKSGGFYAIYGMGRR